MKKLAPYEGLRVFDIKWNATTAGPSPNNNQRIEVFLLGCQKALNNKACKGCFNSITWDHKKAQWSLDPIELADMINERCDPNNKYLTIGGGEPTDQLKQLIPFAKRLKEHGFHIIMYTWRELKKVLDCNFEYVVPTYIEKGAYSYRLNLDMSDLLENIDIVIDGQFEQEKCLYQQDFGDGMINSIGSANQIIWDIKAYNEQEKRLKTKKDLFGKCMGDLVGIYIKLKTNDLVYITK